MTEHDRDHRRLSSGEATTPLRFRQTVRAVVIDGGGEVLLVRFRFRNGTEIWALPGGGLESGEDHEDCLRRELHEELGLRDAAIGPHVWNREHIIAMYTGHDGQRDRVHLVRTEHFDPEPAIGWEALRSEFVVELRWWTVDRIAASTTERFAPRELAVHLGRLLTDGVPAVPVDVGV